MFTNNYLKFRDMMFIGNTWYAGFKSVPGTTFYGTAQYSGKSGDIGGQMHLARCQAMPTESGQYDSSFKPGIYFGSGSTPATKEDYKLESPITAGLAISNPAGFTWVRPSSGVYSATASYAVLNTTAEDITIQEIGNFTPVAESSSKYHFTLMDRTVLDEPIVIAPGESKLVTYKVTFNQTAE